LSFCFPISPRSPSIPPSLTPTFSQRSSDPPTSVLFCGSSFQCLPLAFVLFVVRVRLFFLRKRFPVLGTILLICLVYVRAPQSAFSVLGLFRQEMPGESPDWHRGPSFPALHVSPLFRRSPFSIFLLEPPPPFFPSQRLLTTRRNFFLFSPTMLVFFLCTRVGLLFCLELFERRRPPLEVSFRAATLT